MPTYLIFAPGENESGRKHIGKEPPSVAPGYTVVELSSEQEGREPKSFRLVDGALVDYVEPPVIPREPTREEKLARDYQEAFGRNMGDEFDALYKAWALLLPVLDAAGILPANVKQALMPDSSQPPDTPAGWLGRVAEIKANNPKPVKGG